MRILSHPDTLSQAERQVARAERLVAHQRRVVRQTAVAGKDTSDAEAVLRAMLLSLDRTIKERDVIALRIQH